VAIIKFTQKKILQILLPITILAGIGGTGYFYLQYKNAQLKLQNPTQASQEQTQQLLSKVKNHIVLPSDEIPTIATVSDVDKLKNQPFFAQAKNGDKVLIFNAAKKAILYDPVADKIIDIAPVNVGSSAATVSPASQSHLKIAIYNGTSIIGLTNTLEKDLKGKISNIDIILKDNAKKKDYDKTTVVDLTGNNKDKTAEIAKDLNGDVGSLPDGETKPQPTPGSLIDILIIIGKNYPSK